MELTVNNTLQRKNKSKQTKKKKKKKNRGKQAHNHPPLNHMRRIRGLEVWE